MSSLWKRTIAAAPELERWISGSSIDLEIGRLPRPAWPIVAGAIARACAAQRRTVLILVPPPERFAGELRPWLAGYPPVRLFAAAGLSFLGRPPERGGPVNTRLDARP